MEEELNEREQLVEPVCTFIRVQKQFKSTSTDMLRVNHLYKMKTNFEYKAALTYQQSS